jgi:hypothetical protein
MLSKKVFEDFFKDDILSALFFDYLPEIMKNGHDECLSRQGKARRGEGNQADDSEEVKIPKMGSKKSPGIKTKQISKSSEVHKRFTHCCNFLAAQGEMIAALKYSPII